MENAGTYTIIKTYHQYGQKISICNKKDVRKKLESDVKWTILNDKRYKDNCYIQIDVVNNETGEIRQYWNNRQMETLF